MHYYLENSVFVWALLRETRNKQIFKVEIENKNVLKGGIEICYANPKNIVVNICILGNQRIPIDELFFWLSFDLEKIIERRCHYYVLEYFLCGKDRRVYHGFLKKI